jgi:phosphatidylserine/phosphatidylglycerophosphate/cardiolipin synthase-like enzyme/membrane protein DedA with SNARE-associated domain
MSHTEHKAVFQVGGNCWRVEKTKRVAIAIDGEDYFRAVRETILAARQSVFILGWDIHSRLKLVRDAKEDGFPEQLGALLDFVAKKNAVDVYVLSWDFALIYLIEREPFPLYRLNWQTHSRVRFRMDDRHPVGASQHQKIVVVDDAVAFSGGLDLSKWRWDTSAHRVDDLRRVDPDGNPYPPFHDVQMLVDGDAAAALGELARERWLHATGEKIKFQTLNATNDPWPQSLQPAMHDVSVAIARTNADNAGLEGVREVERLYLDSIAAAERFIYVENQYLTAHCIEEALVGRLQQRDGPEVVIVLPQKTGGWLEQHTMDVLRARLVKKMRTADRNGRLRLYYPQLSSSTDTPLMVHAKVMVIDDRLLRVASSNLSNRSMGLDSECDLAIEADPASETGQAIRRLREQLLAEHLGTEAAVVRETMTRTQSLIATIESLCGNERTLHPLDAEVDPEIDKLVPQSALIDPERPMDAERFVSHFVPDEHKPHTARRLALGSLILLSLLGMAAAWRWTPLGDWLHIDTLVRQAETINANPAGPMLMILIISLAGSLAVPLTLLVVAAVLAFGSVTGFFYSLAGAELSAVMTYATGQGLGRDLVRRYAGDRLNRVSKQLSKRGILTIMTLRIVPVAPFVVINLVAGASHIRFKDFALGTLIGLLPGLIAIAFFADGVVRSIRDPNIGSIAWLFAVILMIAGATFWLRKWLRGRQQAAESGSDA